MNVPNLESTRVSLSQDQALDGNYHFTTLNVPAAGFRGDISYNYEGRDLSLYGMCGKLLLSSITDTQTFTKARSFNHLDATTGVTTGISDTESVQVGSDNFNIKDLYDSSYKLDEDNTITSADFQIQDELTVSSNMEVSGTVETVDVHALASDIVIDAAEDLVITAPDGTRDIVIDESFLITNNKLLATLPEWGKTFQVAFELRIRSFKADWTELLRFTSTENRGGSPGDRIPAVFLHSDGIMAVRTQGQTGEGAFGKNFNVNLRTWIKVEMKQYPVENEWFFEVIIDGSSVWKVKNSSPTLLNDVKVYAARDQWLPIANARIRNFVADAGSTVTVSSNSHPFSVPGKKTFTQPLTVTGDITTSGHIVVTADGIDRTYTSEDSTIGITNRILRKTGAAQTVSTNIELNGNVKINEDLQADSIDGVDFSSISAKYEYTDGIHEVKTDFNFADSAITVANLVTSSVRGRDWSGFVKDIISKDCTDVKVDIDVNTFTLKFTGQYSDSRPVYESTLGRIQLIYASKQWQFRSFDDGSVFGSVTSESICPEVLGWTWTDNTKTYSVYQGI